ncbi:MAG: membrane lipoprotein lipid attachment site-containing protein [Betaproteobacteria bacterium]
MRKIFPAAVILAFLTGCSTVAGWFDRDGSSAGVRSEPVARTTVPADSGVRTDIGRDVGVRNEVGGVPREGVVVSGDGASVGTPQGGYVTSAPGYNTRTTRPYPHAGSIDPATGAVVLNYDEKFWPPVIQDQAFPPQHMWTD